MLNKKITIIGGGHMGQAIASGLLHGKIIDKYNLILSNGEKNIAAAKTADVIIIAVKPKIVSEVAGEIKLYLRKKSIIVSAAACINIDLLEKYFGKKVKIIRIMPNLPVAICRGVVGWMGNNNINASDKKLIEKLLNGLGYLVKCKDEGMLDKLTIISGCGPAFVAYFMDNLQKITQKYGFSERKAERIVYGIFAGALEYLLISKMESEKFIKSIATKGGITEEILNSLNKYKFGDIFFRSLDKGYDKIKTIREELNNDNL